MVIDLEEQRRAFGRWLRTGHLPTVRLADGTELKFNPYHDPRNGQFTFAPGGASGTDGISARYANVRPRNSDELDSATTIGGQTGGRRALPIQTRRQSDNISKRNLRHLRRDRWLGGVGTPEPSRTP